MPINVVQVAWVSFFARGQIDYIWWLLLPILLIIIMTLFMTSFVKPLT